jgi:hypothetical protein
MIFSSLDHVYDKSLPKQQYDRLVQAVYLRHHMNVHFQVEQGCIDNFAAYAQDIDG